MKFGPNLGQIRPKLAKISQKNPNWIEVPILIVETVSLGSRHRFDSGHVRSDPDTLLASTWTIWGSTVVLQYGPNILALSELF